MALRALVARPTLLAAGEACAAAMWWLSSSALLIVLVAVATIMVVQKGGLQANFAASQNNLRQLAQFAAHHANPGSKGDASHFPTDIPAATVVLASVPPENRLSWFNYILPGLDQSRQDVVGLITQIDDTKPWSAERNQIAARTRLLVAPCPGNPPQVAADQPALTSYVGIAGVGADAATLALPIMGRAPARAGAFRYDAATPFDRIGDGLSQTLLIGETGNDLGPWLRGGSSTARGLDDSAGAKPLIGAGGQFGGYFPAGANFAMCDGSVRLFTPHADPQMLIQLATIDGGPTNAIIGE